MRNISKEYRNEIMSQLMRRYLLSGRIPTSDEMEVFYNETVKNIPNLGSRSLISQSKIELVPRSEVKLEDFSKALAFSVIDAKVLRGQLIDLYTEMLEDEVAWSNFYIKTAAKLESLKGRLDRALLLHADSDGYLNTVSDSFTTTNHVSLDSSPNVRIDTNQGLVSILDEDTDTLISEVLMEGSRISVRGVVNETGVSIGTLAGTQLDSITDPTVERGWIGLASLRRPEPVTLMMRVDLAGAQSLSRIDYQKIRRNAGRGSIVCQVTRDRRNWITYGTGTTLSGTVSFIDLVEDVVSIRFIITQERYDHHRPDTGYVYSFDCQAIRAFHTIEAQSRTQGILESTGYDVPSFNKVALEVCDVVSDSTLVSYDLSVDGETWRPITPLNKESGSVDQVLYFSNINETSNQDPLYVGNVLDTAYLSGDIIPLLAYQDKISIPSMEVSLLNYKILFGEVEMVPFETFRLFKDSQTVSSTETYKGWVLESGRLSTVFYVEIAENLHIDVGTTTIILDGEDRQGVISITRPGWHTLNIPQSSYSFIDLGASSIEELKERDVLYPYNLKYLIEGYSYGAGFGAEKVYSGFTRWAGKELKRTASFEYLLSNLDSSFYVSKDNLGNRVFVVQIPDSIEEFSGSNYYLSYNRSETNFERIFVRATLETHDPRITPLLSEYTVRMGY